MSHPVRDERGAATVVALALVAVLLVVAAVATGTIAVVLAHRRAQVAADLASLAAAGALRAGADPCTSATRIADRHHAEVAGCLVDGQTVLVVTEVRLAGALGGGGVRARSRAGPQGAPTPAGLR